MIFGNLLRTLMILSVTLLAGGCLLPMPPPAETDGGANLVPPRATRIERLEVFDVGQGSRVGIQADGTLTYQIFQLDNPPRLLLNLDKVTLAPAIQPRNLEQANISGLFPTQTPEGNVRLEVMLKQRLEYEVKELDTGLDLTVLHAATPADANQKASLQDIQVTHSVSGTTVRIVGQGVFPKPQTYRFNDPPRLVVDLFGPVSKMSTERINVNSPEVNSINVGSTPDKIRMVVDLTDQEVTFRVDENEGLPIILLSHGSPELTQPRVSPQVEDIRFSRDGEVDVIHIQMDRSDVTLDSRRDGEDLLLTLKGIILPKKLIRRMDVSAFGGLIKAIDAYNEEKDTRMVVRLDTAPSRHEVMQKDKEILVKVRTLRSADSGQHSIYTGEKISMDFKDIDIQNALKLIAEISGMNIITSDTVTGTLTMRLLDVPWDQALELILESKGLGKTLQGNVLRIAPLEELRNMAEARIQANQSAEQLEPLVTEIIPVSYGQATELKIILEEGDAAMGTRILSARGAASVDMRSNSLVVKDTTSNLVRVRQMVKKLDQPVQQVLIEARIVEVERSTSTSMGINWGFSYAPHQSSGRVRKWAVAPSASSAGTVYDSTAAAAPRADLATPAANVGMLNRINATPNIGFHLGTISPLLDLDIELGAIEYQRKGRTISSPRLLTTNNVAASIRQGVQQPYQTVEEGNAQINFIEASLRLDVTPKVTPDGYITLKVKASNNSVGTTGNPPPVNTKEVDTQVLLKNGETIVLGGIYTNSDSGDQYGIPGLQHIPFFGWLFKGISKSVGQTELLIFITPRLMVSTS